MRTLDKIIYKVSCKYGAPMGRANIGSYPAALTYGKCCKLYKKQTKVFDCKVPMSADGAYDKGGAYWGIGKELRVRYTKDLEFIQFYRKGDTLENI